MSIPLPDIYNYSAFSDWTETSEKEGTTTEDQIKICLQEGSPIAHLRAAVLGYRLEPRSESQVAEWLLHAYTQGDRVVNIMVLATKLHIAVNSPYLKAIPDASTPADATESLTGLLSEVRTMPPHPLRLEAELRVMHSLFQTSVTIGDTGKMEQLSAQLVSLSLLFGNPRIAQKYKMIRAYAMSGTGRYNSSADILGKLHYGNDFQSITNINEISTLLAIALTNLGATDKAIQVLELALIETPDSPSLIGWLQWIRSLTGNEVFDSSIRMNSDMKERYGWHVNALKAFSAAESIAPIGKSLVTREQHLQSALSLSERGLRLNRTATDILFDRWLRGRTRLHLNEYGTALQELVGISDPVEEDLINRALLSALRLELAMTPLEALHTPLLEAEEQLRATFRVARSLPYADAEALATVIARWHPQSAAYAAVMPLPIMEFLPSLESLIRVNPRPTWRGQAVPSRLVSHLTRIGLRVPTFSLTLGGNVLYQAARLVTRQPPVPIWGPVVPALPIILALLRGGQDHHFAARRMLQDFGGLPPNDPDGALNEVVELTQMVASGRLPLTKLLHALAEL